MVVLGAPTGFDPGAPFVTALGKPKVDVAIVFCPTRLRFEHSLPRVRSQLTETGAIWIAWPKQAAKRATDMTEHVVREVALPTGLVDNKVCAIDDTWASAAPP